MEMTQKLSDKQIHEIAVAIDTNSVCYINSETGEYILMMSDEDLDDYGMSWDDKDGPNNSWPDWQKEMYTDIKADMAKINSWKDVIQIEKPPPRESFEFMECFVAETIPAGILKERFWNALSRSHPFSNFNAIVHNCAYREAWFAFKQKALEEYVRDRLREG